MLSAATLAVALLLGACAPAPKVQSPRRPSRRGPRARGGRSGRARGVLRPDPPVGGLRGRLRVRDRDRTLSWKDPAQGRSSSRSAPAGVGGQDRLAAHEPRRAGRIGRRVHHQRGRRDRGTRARGLRHHRVRPARRRLLDPVVCLDDAAKDESLSRAFADSDEGRTEMAADLKAWADACAENSGDLLGNVDTQSAARDMDMLRAVLGDSTLNYLGFSYGTQLGATYAGCSRRRSGAWSSTARSTPRSPPTRSVRSRPSASRTRCAPTSRTAREARTAR
ncbi:hypothetical protein NKG05_07555 [Oerskovia sp. M15]